MSIKKKIISQLDELPDDGKAEVLDFVEFIKHRALKKEDTEFKQLSLKQALRDMDDEPGLYSQNDIIESSS